MLEIIYNQKMTSPNPYFIMIFVFFSDTENSVTGFNDHKNKYNNFNCILIDNWPQTQARRQVAFSMTTF